MSSQREARTGLDDAWSSVAPPRPPRPTAAQICGRIAFGLVIVAGLVGAVLLGMPALQVSDSAHSGSTQHTTAGAAG